MSFYIPAHFAMQDRAAMCALIESNAFGMLVSGGASGIDVSHIPFLLDRDGEAVRLLGHVARSNPHWRGLEAAKDIVAVFEGPHAYISPSWYENHPAVPTWNYAVVHAHGKARLLEEAELHELLMRLSSIYEAGSAKPWRMSELPAPYVDSMLAMIVGFEIEVERLEGKFKLSQNRPAEIPRVIAALEARGDAQLAALMREHSPVAKG